MPRAFTLKCCLLVHWPAPPRRRFKVTSTGELAPANYFIRYNTSGGVSALRPLSAVPASAGDERLSVCTARCTFLPQHTKTSVVPQMHPEHCTAKPGEWQLVPFSATYEGYLCQ